MWLHRHFFRLLTSSLAFISACTTMDLQRGMHAYHTGQTIQAMDLLRPLAENGNATAQYYLAEMYTGPQALTRDYHEATLWWSKAANAGMQAAQLKMGIVYVLGYGIPRNTQKGMAWLSKVANAGNVSAQYNLGLIHEHAEDPNLHAAALWYRKAASSGMPMAQLKLGFMYQHGLGVTLNHFKAIYWFEQASKHASHSLRLDSSELLHYARGIGFVYGSVTASTALQQELQAQKIHALNYIADYYSQKHDRRSWLKAIKAYNVLASMGHADAYIHLAEMYATGQGVPKSQKSACSMYLKAAQQDVLLAQNRLASCYKFGKGGEKNLQKAFYWYKQAAKAGDPEAQWQLAKSYEDGEGVKKDKMLAYMWYHVLSNDKDVFMKHRAKKKLDSMVSRLTQAQLIEANRRITKIKKAPASKPANVAKP